MQSLIFLYKFILYLVVATTSDSTGTVPEYCECERIGAYALGSMRDFNPEDIDIRDSNPVLDMSMIFEEAPYGTLTMRQLAGEFIGSFGPWAPKWNQSGCCSSVQLECHSECAYLSGCNNVSPKNSIHKLNLPQSRPNTLEFNTFLETEKSIINLENRFHNINEQAKVYPNPVNDELIIDVTDMSDEYHTNLTITIYDINGTEVSEITH